MNCVPSLDVFPRCAGKDHHSISGSSGGKADEDDQSASSTKHCGGRTDDEAMSRYNIPSMLSTPSSPVPVHPTPTSCSSDPVVPVLHRRHFDQLVFPRLGAYGPYQLFMLISIQWAMLASAGNYIFITFATLRPQCAADVTTDQDICSRIASPNCTASARIFHSLYDDANFVCPQSHLPHHMQTLQAIGSAFGALLGGHLADAVGRRPVCALGALAMVVCGLGAGAAPSWHALAAAMGGMGLAYGAFVDASMTLASETVGPRHRIVQTLAFQWSLVLQLCALIAFLTADWRHYLLLVNGVCLPCALLVCFAWRESPRWLLQKGRAQRACRELNAIARFNRRPMPRFTVAELKTIWTGGDECEKSKLYTVWHLFRTRRLAIHSAVMVLSALTVELAVSVIIFDVQVLAGNPFMNVALYGLLRIWVPFFVVLVEKRAEWVGRRALFIGSQSFSCACFCAVLLLLALHARAPPSSASGIARTVLALLGGVLNSSLFFTAYKQYSIELYPTPMRGMALGSFGIVERVGGALAPQLVALNHWLWPGTALGVTAALMLLSALGGALALPETRHTQMPDVVVKGAEAEAEAEERKEAQR